MANKAKEVFGVEELEAIADRGYYNGEEIIACAKAGITVTLPKPMTSGAKAEGRFGKQDFAYLADKDAYRCPARPHECCRSRSLRRDTRLLDRERDRRSSPAEPAAPRQRFSRARERRDRQLFLDRRPDRPAAARLLSRDQACRARHD
jgi:hypothetical protein